MRYLETVQTIKLRIRQPAAADLPAGPLPFATIERMRRDAMRSAQHDAAAQGAEVLEYTVHSIEVVEG